MTRVTYPQFPFLSFNPTDSLKPVRPLGESLVKEKKTSPFNCGSVVVLQGSSIGKIIQLDQVLWNGPNFVPEPIEGVPVERDVELVDEAPPTFEYPFEDQPKGPPPA